MDFSQISTTVPLTHVKMGDHVVMALDPMCVAVLPGTKAISVRSVSHICNVNMTMVFVCTYLVINIGQNMSSKVNCFLYRGQNLKPALILMTIDSLIGLKL